MRNQRMPVGQVVGFTIMGCSAAVLGYLNLTNPAPWGTCTLSWPVAITSSAHHCSENEQIAQTIFGTK